MKIEMKPIYFERGTQVVYIKAKRIRREEGKVLNNFTILPWSYKVSVCSFHLKDET